MKMDDMVLVSVDDHVVEPPNTFIDHYPAHKKDSAPRIVAERDREYWSWEGQRYSSHALNAVVGRPRNEYGVEPLSYEHMRPGCYDVKARIEDMDVNGVLGSICFPTFARFGGNTFLNQPNREAALLAVRAYNDWHVHDWCGAAPGRLIPLICLPLWDMKATLEELSRMSKLGVHAVTFPDNPTRLGLPSVHNEYWEPFWKACSDFAMVINCHIGSGEPPQHPSDETPHDAWIINMPMTIAFAAGDWTVAEFWDRYPKLRMALSEGGIGWVPYFLERADFTYEHHHEWTHTDFGKDKPSDRFKRHIITCFIDDQFGIRNLHDMNEDMVTWECDYPHSDTVWPNCPEYLWKCVKDLSASRIDKITHANVMKQYSYDPFQVFGGRQNCTVGALRARATHVDVSPRMGMGGLSAEWEQSATASGKRKPITCGDVNKMLAKA